MTGHTMAKMILAGSAALMTAGAFAAEADYPIHPVPFTKVNFTSGVLAERQDVNRKVTARTSRSTLPVSLLDYASPLIVVSSLPTDRT